ncbi:transglutaminase family protein [Nocardioides sp. TRM66260-LWL]|uniref:transglutaminase family protein n=1 Tax=Nocardioides sp. TRM66260-LWL TaxID=2874478 RepID=UPI001CC54F67|nr:transglutaminase family protein [Nocardioides sp. TRM66260-LWL]MBZ5735981.1 transglutaminase family protein [Nocardioides sp. TRM66260-LWL]
MSIKVALEHRTTYAFAEPVAVAPHVVRLRPAPHCRTPIEAYALHVEPAEHFVNWQQDPFGNWQARLVFPKPTDRLEITVGLVADLMVINPFDFFVEESAERFPFDYDEALAADLAPYLRPVEDAEDAAAFREGLAVLRTLPDDGLPTVQLLADVNRAVHEAVAYSVRMEPGVQTPDETLRLAVGSCRDSAWLLVALLRQLGLAARFVSGYLVQLAADQESLDGPSGPAEDFTDLHAWCEVFVPGAGWVGLDPTSALFAGEGHLPLSATPHPSAAAPIEGATEPVEVTFSFSNEVRRVHEDPRVTLPYTDEQWARIDAVGEAVDARLAAGDVRLTMGGEPTFVALDRPVDPADPAAAQWATDADGAQKRELAGRLAQRLFERHATGGLVHRGQGKWYPGEPLPRWSIALQWRADGVPLWEDPGLLADPWSPDGVRTTADAHAVGVALLAELDLPEEHLLAAHEDPLAALVEEVRRPVGARPDPHDDEGADAARVAELDAAQQAGHDPAGYVLPLTTGEEGWTAPRWRFRRGRLVLTPGTSAVGLRLPLDAIAWTPPPAEAQPTTLAPAPLRAEPPEPPPVAEAAADDVARTAVAVEARDGHVHVFLPPVARLEDYVALVRLVERAAARAGVPVVLEGYQPPPDPRLRVLSVTPDPGVVEVNVQPSGSWAELRELAEGLYEEARLARLTTEKFDLDGTHTGTGGGNHLTLGGPTPADSPLLRRPALLAGLVATWQRHPSLSYLFSGRFVGPTSQAPRFDEGRPEAVGEMEIALAEIDRITAALDADGLEPRPWLVDRALRHLLTDLTGNTHRSELCIDKLYSPDSGRGRLGLLELRGFEMPPHPRMALVQALLVRALVALTWERAERGERAPLVRWGTRLHDDLLLHEGVRRDARAVLDELRSAGLALEDAWLEPFLEFRFPRLGVARVPAADVELELRAGIEPWLVLGEEATAGGTARYVDSSVERLQVTVRGIDPRQHLVTCQGVPVPLTATDRPGEHYAGVRYRAWQPWSALHPSIAVHAPLHLEVVDVHAGVSLGGATYHVTHPGGRAYATAPVNAAEAEARRARRFEAHGHTSGRVDVAALREAALRAASPEHPRTLDLRRVPARPPRT